MLPGHVGESASPLPDRRQRRKGILADSGEDPAAAVEIKASTNHLCR